MEKTITIVIKTDGYINELLSDLRHTIDYHVDLKNVKINVDTK